MISTKYEANCPDYDIYTDSWVDHWKPISREDLRKWWKDFCQDITDGYKPTFNDFLEYQIGYAEALREVK